MSDAQIEQIRRKAKLIAENLYDTPDDGGPCCAGSMVADVRDLAETIEMTFLPLIEAARIAGAQGIDNQEALEATQAVFQRGREEGAKEMRERAARMADEFDWYSAGMPNVDVEIVHMIAEKIASSIRALPSPEAP